MIAQRARSLLLAAVLLVSASIAGCVGAGDLDGADDDRPLVLATFYPVGYLAERIGGDDVRVQVLMGPGVEPHDYEPTVQDAMRFASADLVIAQGAEFEPWLPGLIENLEDRAPTVVEAVDGLRLVEFGGHGHEHDDGHHDDNGHDEHEDAHHDDNHGHDNGHDEHEDAHHHDDDHHEDPDHHDDDHGHDDHDHGDYDPHTWMDPVRFAESARVVEAAFAEAFPELAAAFAARADALVAELEALDEDFQVALADCATRNVIVNHNAFAYLADRYDFEVHSIHGFAPDAEPDSRTIVRLIEEVREHDIRIVFHEELVSARVAEVIAEETGAEVRVLSPIEGLTQEMEAAGEDYMSLQRANLANLAEAMRCG